MGVQSDKKQVDITLLLDFVNNTMRFAVMYCTILSRSPFRFSA